MALFGFYMKNFSSWQWSADYALAFFPSWKIFTVPAGWGKSPDFIFLFLIFIDFFDVLGVFHNISLLFKQK